MFGIIIIPKTCSIGREKECVFYMIELCPKSKIKILITIVLNTIFLKCATLFFLEMFAPRILAQRRSQSHPHESMTRDFTGDFI